MTVKNGDCRTDTHLCQANHLIEARIGDNSIVIEQDDTEQKNRASFERESGATRLCGGW